MRGNQNRQALYTKDNDGKNKNILRMILKDESLSLMFRPKKAKIFTFREKYDYSDGKKNAYFIRKKSFVPLVLENGTKISLLIKLNRGFVLQR